MHRFLLSLQIIFLKTFTELANFFFFIFLENVQ